MLGLIKYDFTPDKALNVVLNRSIVVSSVSFGRIEIALSISLT